MQPILGADVAFKIHAGVGY